MERGKRCIAVGLSFKNRHWTCPRLTSNGKRGRGLLHQKRVSGIMPIKGELSAIMKPSAKETNTSSSYSSYSEAFGRGSQTPAHQEETVAKRRGTCMQSVLRTAFHAAWD
ncbi:hypothetical protein CORC01_04777 [Colletotrichum orchidophilum]|uniref:Uncharacterized protein n=1 Tax=Colletotrichum orchidophilum TaxID=1209926 RepID=A0A1G4BEW5_9PEZI|nr:uncharacterized protein CORC01_04777 [Colletotrichum orchidophilum]OHE99876.1 hypothetical protein CORC01_04777 [Colletotrichum orchidophilum]